jgi:hypothetical protein
MSSVLCTEHLPVLLNEDTRESHISDTYLYPSALTRSCGTRGVDCEKRRWSVQIRRKPHYRRAFNVSLFTVHDWRAAREGRSRYVSNRLYLANGTRGREREKQAIASGRGRSRGRGFCRCNGQDMCWPRSQHSVSSVYDEACFLFMNHILSHSDRSRPSVC